MLFWNSHKNTLPAVCFKYYILDYKKKKIYIFFSSLGVVQGIITGIRGLCNGLGPALYGFIFFLFHVELNELSPDQTSEKNTMIDAREEVSLKLCEVCSIKFCGVKVCHVSIILCMFLVFWSVCRSGEEL